MESFSFGVNPKLRHQAQTRAPGQSTGHDDMTNLIYQYPITRSRVAVAHKATHRTAIAILCKPLRSGNMLKLN